MDFQEDILHFLQEPNFMVLGTLKKNNAIQMSVVWYVYMAKSFYVSTTTDRAKYHNITRNPEVSFVIFNQRDPYQYLEVQGTCTISTANVHELIDQLSFRYTGNKIYQGDPQRIQDRVNLVVTPQNYVWKGK